MCPACGPGGAAAAEVGLRDPRGLLQPKCFCDPALSAFSLVISGGSAGRAHPPYVPVPLFLAVTSQLALETPGFYLTSFSGSPDCLFVEKESWKSSALAFPSKSVWEFAKILAASKLIFIFFKYNLVVGDDKNLMEQ